MTKAQIDLLIGASLLANKPGDLHKVSLQKFVHTKKEAIEMLSEVLKLVAQVEENVDEFAKDCEFIHGDVVYPKGMNLPTLHGALNGLKLVDGIDCSKLCHGCAFRQGSHANQSFTTTSDAQWCLDDETTFMCHENVPEEESPRKACKGYAQAKRLSGRKG